MHGIVSQGASGPADSELVVITGHLGWGKTRIIQELYSHLASRQPAGKEHWPSELVPDVDTGPVLIARKKVEPGSFQVAAGTELPYLWWGLSCQERQDARLANILADDISQLVTNLGPALDQIAAKGAGASAAAGIVRTLIAAAPTSDIPGIIDGISNVRSDIRTALGYLAEKRHAEETRWIDPSVSDRFLIETWVGTLASLLRKARVPLVVVVDDAHWADRSAIEFLDELVENVPCVVVMTVRPDQIEIPDQDGEWRPSNDHPSDASGLITRWQERLTVLPLTRLSESASEEVAAAALGIEASHPIAFQLADRASGNPLLLRMYAELGKVRTAARLGDPLEVNDLANLPEDVRAEFKRRWHELPSQVQTVLAVTSLHGDTFVPTAVAKALASAGRSDLASTDHALTRAYQPHHCISDPQQETCEFTDPHFREIAEHRARELFTQAELEEIDAEFVATVRWLRTSGGWTNLTSSAKKSLLAHHRCLVEVGRGGDIRGVVATYVDSANILPRSKPGWTAAISLIDDAITFADQLDPGTLLAVKLRKPQFLQAAGRADQALPLYELSLQASEQVLGKDHEVTLASRNNLADCLTELKRPEEALPHVAQTLSDAKRSLTPGHFGILAARSNLANCYVKLGEPGRALPLFEEAIPEAAQLLGIDHSVTFTARNNQVVCLNEVGRANEALPQAHEVLTEARQVLGTDDAVTLTSQHNLAECHLHVGSQLEALDLLEGAVAGRERTLGQSHPDTNASRVRLAGCLDDLGRPEDAARVRAGMDT